MDVTVWGQEFMEWLHVFQCAVMGAGKTELSLSQQWLYFLSGNKLPLREQAWQTSSLASWEVTSRPPDKSIHRWQRAPQGWASNRYAITSPGFPWCSGKRCFLGASTKKKLPGPPQGGFRNWLHSEEGILPCWSYYSTLRTSRFFLIEAWAS